MVLLVSLTACHSWRPLTIGAQGLPAEEQSVRVTSTGGAVITVLYPRMVNDSIAGSTEFGPIRMDTEDLRLVEVQRVSLFKSLGFVTINAAVIAGFVALFIHVQPHYYF